MSWVLAIAAAWTLLAAVACLFVGRAIQLADRRAVQAAPRPDASHIVAGQFPRTTAPRTAVGACADAVPAARSAPDEPDRPFGPRRRPPAPRRVATPATRRQPDDG